MNNTKMATRLEDWLSGRGLHRLRLWRSASPCRRAFGLWYINGPDVLPQPLSREEEAEVIIRLESDGEAREGARAVLIERNLPQLQQVLAARVHSFSVAVSVRKGRDGRA